MDRASRPSPITSERLRGGRVDGPASRMAAVGAMRVARIAGTTPASTVTTVPTTKPGSSVPVVSTSGTVGSLRSSAWNRARMPEAMAMPAATPTSDATTAEQARLEQHGAQHLAPGGADAAQHRQLPRALLDRDRERVEDDERAHEHGDAGEGQQEVAQVVDERRLLAHRAVGVGLRRLHPQRHVRRQAGGLDAPHDLGVGHAGPGAHADGVHLARPVEQPLGGRQVEHGEGGAGGADVAQPHEPGDPVALGRLARGDVDLVADPEVPAWAAVVASIATSPACGQRPSLRSRPVRRPSSTEYASFGGPSLPRTLPLRSISCA